MASAAAVALGKIGNDTATSQRFTNPSPARRRRFVRRLPKGASCAPNDCWRKARTTAAAAIYDVIRKAEVPKQTDSRSDPRRDHRPRIGRHSAAR